MKASFSCEKLAFLFEAKIKMRHLPLCKNFLVH